MLQNTPTVYLSRLASAITAKVSAKQRLSAELSRHTWRLSGDFYPCGYPAVPAGTLGKGSDLSRRSGKTDTKLPGKYPVQCCLHREIFYP